MMHSEMPWAQQRATEIKIILPPLVKSAFLLQFHGISYTSHESTDNMRTTVKGSHLNHYSMPQSPSIWKKAVKHCLTKTFYTVQSLQILLLQLKIEYSAQNLFKSPLRFEFYWIIYLKFIQITSQHPTWELESSN